MLFAIILSRRTMPTMDISEVLKYISYKPKSVVETDGGQTVATFRKFKGVIPLLTVDGDVVALSLHKDGHECAEVFVDSRNSSVQDGNKRMLAVVRDAVRTLHDLYSGGISK